MGHTLYSSVAKFLDHLGNVVIHLDPEESVNVPTRALVTSGC